MAATPKDGTVLETTTRQRVIPTGQLNSAFEFWDYLEKLKPEDASRHILYVYRDDPSPTMQVGKFVYPWNEIPWNDREEAEAIIAQRWGGRTFRVFVKDRSQRMGVGKLYINAPPKALAPPAPEPQNPYASGPIVQPMGGDYGATARVAETAIHTMANQEQAGVRLALDAIATTSSVMKNMLEKPPAAPPPQSHVMDQFMAVMIQRAMADPFEQFAKMMTMMQTMQAATNPTGPLNPLMTKFLDVAADRVFNPPASSGPAVSMGAELVRVLPNIAQYVQGGLADYARIAEAQRDAIAMQRGGTPPPVREAPRPQTAVLPPAQPTAPPTATNGASPMADVMSFIESKIVEILAEPQSAEAAAEETIDFLYRMDKAIVPQLVGHGEAGLMALFQTRELLKPATANPARLGEFIRAFLRCANENGDGIAEQKPN